MFNEEQKRAIEAGMGPKMIIAGAGTGKTTVITHRIIELINKGIKPEKIFAMTFTNKATEEMRERVVKEKGILGASVKISTFHSFALKILRLFPFGLPTDFDETFSVIDEKDKLKIIKKEKKRVGIDTARETKKEISVVSKYKNNEAVGLETNLSKKNRKVFELYQSYLENNNLLDFDDILVYFLKALEKEKFYESLSKRIDYILVDEFQDTNVLQYEILKKIILETKNIFVVGDPDQSIYKFRGAEYKNTENFNLEFEPEIISLKTNYRSTQEILDFSNHLINNNERLEPKFLKGLKSDLESVTIKNFKDYQEELHFIVNKIKKINLKDKSVAVIYRNNKQSSFFEQELTKNNVPHIVFGDMNFFDRLEIKFMINLCHIIKEPHNDHYIGEIINVPKRGISDKRLEIIKAKKGVSETVFESIETPHIFGFPKKTEKALGEFKEMMDAIILRSQKSGEIKEFFEKTLKLLGYTEDILDREEDFRMENIDIFINSFFPKDTGEKSVREVIVEAMDEIVLTSPSEKGDMDEKVVLTTFHRAKGLEFDFVFLPFLQEGVVPSLIDTTDYETEEIEEERRVFYVGVTRAKEELNLSFSYYYRQFGEPMKTPSRFLLEGQNF